MKLMDVTEAIAFCFFCDGDGSVQDNRTDLLWTCPWCNGTGELKALCYWQEGEV